MDEPILASQLLKTTGIITATPDETLSRVLPQLRRSHDVVFVFDAAPRKERGELLGVVSPHYVLFKKHFPAETKVVNCLFHPPKLSPDTPYWEIIRLMLESRLYFLPVFDGDEFLGIVSVRRLFDALAKQSFIKKLALPVRRSVITIKKSASAADAYNTLRDKKISRIVVVNDTGRKVGIVSQYGLQLALNKPKEGQSSHSRVGDKKKYLNQPLARYFKNNVVTVSSRISGEKLFEQMLTSDTSSIVVLAADYTPVNIVSTSDVLRAILAAHQSSQQPRVQVTISQLQREDAVKKLFASLVEKQHTKTPIAEANLHIEGNKPMGKRKEYEVKIALKTRDHHIGVGTTTAFIWDAAVRQAFTKAARQLK